VKRVLFSAIPLVVFAVLLEVGLLVVGIEPIDATEDPYVGFSSALPLFTPAVDPQGRRIWQTAHNKRKFFNEQHFDAEKSPGARRVFCLGGSTTYGRPYHDPTSFCGWLREYLIAVAPEMRWEVVNAGGISYASYRVAEVARELAGHRPDLFIVYTGHNEFLEDRTYAALRDRPSWIRSLDAFFLKTRIYSVLSRIIRRDPESLDAEVSTRLDGSVGPDAYSRDDEWQEAVIAHFRMNLERIIGISRNADIEIVLVLPADNLRDCTPFKSESDSALGEVERARFDRLLAEARESGEPASRRALLQRAVDLDPLHAEAQFRLGRALEELGDREGAQRAFVRARDEDVCPLRMLSPMLDVVRGVAESERVPLLDYPALIEGASGDDSSIRGAEWFLDHVHPTIEGHALLARALLDEISRLGWIDSDARQRASAVAVSKDRVLERIDDRELGLSMRNLAKVLSWAGKNEDASRAAEHALDLLGPDAESLFILSLHASNSGDHAEAVALLREALRLDPDWVKARHNLGVELARSGRLEDAVAAYDAVIEIAPEHESVHFNRANALVRLDREEEAIGDYQTVLTRNPEDQDARHNLDRLMQRSTAHPSSP